MSQPAACTDRWLPAHALPHANMRCESVAWEASLHTARSAAPQGDGEGPWRLPLYAQEMCHRMNPQLPHVQSSGQGMRTASWQLLQEALDLWKLKLTCRVFHRAPVRSPRVPQQETKGRPASLCGVLLENQALELGSFSFSVALCFTCRAQGHHKNPPSHGFALKS